MKTVKTGEKNADKIASKKATVSPKKVGEKTIKNKAGKEEFFVASGKTNVPISNPQKIYFPDDKITKKMVVEYYQSVAKYILPFLKDRPESLKRNPNGIMDAGFYHKDAGENAPEFIKSFPVYSESSDKEITI